MLVLSQTIEFLGLTIDLAKMELQLPLHKIKMIWAESRKLLREETTSAHAFARLLEKMNATPRMAYLRERYRGQHLSEEAADLMLKLWRTKSNRSYDQVRTLVF